MKYVNQFEIIHRVLKRHNISYMFDESFYKYPFGFDNICRCFRNLILIPDHVSNNFYAAYCEELIRYSKDLKEKY